MPRPHLNAEPLEGREVPASAGLYAIGGGPGGLPLVKVYNSNTNALVADFLAFEPTFTGGVTVAVADITNDGFPEVIVGAGPGGGPRVRIFNGLAFTGASGFTPAPTDGSLISDSTVVADFFTYESSQRGGVYVAGGDITGTSNAELIVGAGPGGGPRVRIFDGAAITEQRTNFTGNQAGDVSADFFAYESTFRDGVLVSVSPTVGGTSAAEITVAPGDGGAPRVRVLNATQIRLEGQSYTSMKTGDAIADFISGDSSSRGGAFVATADFNRDGIPDIAVGSGVNSTGTVTVYSGSAIQTQGTSFTGSETGDVIDSFNVGGSGYTNGVTVGAAIATSGTADGLLFTGYGGAGVDGEAVLNNYEVVTGGVSRQVVNTVSLDGTDRNIFVSE